MGLEQNEQIAIAIRNYKKGLDTAKHVSTLWQAWSKRFSIIAKEPPHTDGALDAVVCATVAYLYHHTPEKLLRLRHDVTHRTGRGPFYVLAKNTLSAA